MHELYRVSRRPYLIAARPPDLAFNFLRTDYGLSWAFYNGSIDYNGGLPISEATGTYSVPTFSYYHSLSFFGRSANVVASLPYGAGNFQGTLGVGQHLYRSGLADSVFRFSVNLKGGPAMPVQKFLKWKQKVLLGASLKVVAPTGQYDPTKLINWGGTPLIEH